MDRNTTGPLTPEEAKARLRSIAGSMGPVAWIREKPRESLGMALLAGMIAGNASTTNEVMANNIISLLLNTSR
jgi:hypothetical protein